MESHILPCPVCGVGINATLAVCPVCKSETHFVDAPAAESVHKCAACGEPVPVKAAFCPACGEPTGLAAQVPASRHAAAPYNAAPVPPSPQQQQPMAPVPPTPQQQQPQKSKLTPLIVGLLAALAVAVIVMLILTLTSKGGNTESEPESVSTNLAMEHTLDSIKATLPVAAEEVIRYTNDKPALFYLYDNRLHRIDGNTLDDEIIDFQEGNSKAKIDYRNGGIITAKPTKDDRYLFVHANSSGGDDQKEMLCRYDVKTGRVNILGFGNSVSENGSGYVIRGDGWEKRVDAYGNIVGDRGTGEADDDEASDEVKQSDKPRTSQPSRPRVEETPQTEVITVQPEPVKPAEPQVQQQPQQQSTGFHLEEI